MDEIQNGYQMTVTVGLSGRLKYKRQRRRVWRCFDLFLKLPVKLSGSVMDEVDDNEFEEVGTKSKVIVEEKDFEETSVDSEGTDVMTRQRSQVYTATKDTLFQEAAKDTKTHSLVSKSVR